MSIILDLIESGDCTLYHDYRSGDFRDKSGNGNHGTPTNLHLSKDGIAPTYLSSGYLTVPNCTLFDNTNKYGTIFILVKDQGDQERIGFCEYSLDSGASLSCYTNAASDRYFLNDGATTSFATATSPFDVSTKSHCVVFENGQIPSFYYNGVNVLSGNVSLTFGTLGNGDFEIGRAASVIYCTATIQAVFITKTKLTADEISQLHSELSALKWPSKPITNTSKGSLIDLNATGLVSAYDFRNGSLTDLKGSSNGTQVGSLDFVRDRWGTGIYSSRQACAQFDVDSFTGAYYVSCWARIDSYTASNQIFWSLKPLSDVRHFSLAHFNSNQIGLFDYNASELVLLYRTDNPYNHYGTWLHAVAGIGSDGIVRLWIDGKPSSNDYTTAVNLDSRSIIKLDLLSKVSFGTGIPSLPFDGSISNVEIYNTDLTDDDVSAIYNRGKNIKSFFDRGLIASGKTFSSGFIENSGLFVSNDSGKIETQVVNGYESKVLVSTGTAFGAYIPTSMFGINKKQAAYGTWNFAFKKGVGDLVQIAIANTDKTVSGSGVGYVVQFESDDSVRLLYFGLATLFDTVTSIDNITDYAIFRVTRDYSGTFKFWINGTQIGTTATNNTLTEAPYIALGSFDSTDCQLILQSENPDYNFWYSPNVIEP